MSKDNLILGRSAEDEAARFLKKKGYSILAQNYRTALGEVDIVAKDKDTVCFIEVKARSSDKFGTGFEAILPRKQRQVAKAALVFLKENKLLDKKARFDVVSLNRSGGALKADLIKNAFELDEKFSY